MAANDDYVVDVDRSEVALRSEPNVVIMDNQTGVEQYHSQWNNGLHQFLQMKHTTRVSTESLKAVFVSNVAFFKRYGRSIYGLSGTLGSLCEREFLEHIYRVSSVVIPTFVQSRYV